MIKLLKFQKELQKLTMFLSSGIQSYLVNGSKTVTMKGVHEECHLIIEDLINL